MTLGHVYIERSRVDISSVFNESERTSACRKKLHKSIIPTRCSENVETSVRSLNRATGMHISRNNELQPISVLAIIRQEPESSTGTMQLLANVAASKFLITKWKSLSTCDRMSAYLQFLDHATWRFVTKQFKLAACTIPAGSKLERHIIKIFDIGHRISDGVE